MLTYDDCRKKNTVCTSTFYYITLFTLKEQFFLKEQFKNYSYTEKYLADTFSKINSVSLSLQGK